jgi:hypothetical protein
MTFKIRTEAWRLADASNTVGAPLLRSMIGDAVEYDDDTEAPTALPVPANREAYALAVVGLDGAATVQIGMTGDEFDPARGLLVTAGARHWFVVEPDSLIEVAEYELPGDE